MAGILMVEDLRQIPLVDRLTAGGAGVKMIGLGCDWRAANAQADDWLWSLAHFRNLLTAGLVVTPGFGRCVTWILPQRGQRYGTTSMRRQTRMASPGET
jgi:hypothetical protein